MKLLIIRYHNQTSSMHIQTLVQDLEIAGCQVRCDPLWAQLYLNVPASLEA